MLTRTRHPVLFAAVLALGCGAESAQVKSTSIQKIAAQGAYATELVPGEKPPSNDAGKPATPKVTSDFAQLPTTNDWWSSLIWQYQEKAGNPYSEIMFPHPLSAKALANGIELGYTTEPVVQERNYEYPHRPDLVAGVQGLAAPDARVASYSDWTVTAELRDASHALRFTLGHGLPFVYFTNVTGNASITAVDADVLASVKSRQGNVATLNVRGHHYALFAPPGATWETEGNALVSNLGNAGYYSVAVLPDDKAETLALFTKYAHSFVKGTKVTYAFDAASGSLKATFGFETEDKSGKGADGTLFAMYRHQAIHADNKGTGHSYVSPRGEMKLGEGKAFTVDYALGTLLPTLPAVGGYGRGKMVGMLKIGARGDLFPRGLEGTRDSYWEGKSFGRNADLVYIADEVGKTGIRDHLLEAIKAELEDWFDGQNPRYFYYDQTWRTVIGVPSQYYSGSMMNDHHFHYGYFIYAAAVVAQFDPAWGKQWTPAVEMLIRDAGNWKRDDDRFPFMRNFDPYAGHSWASGTTWGGRGNNEESSSEDVNFAGAVALWGEVTQNPEIRDTGLFMYTSLMNSIEQYWFDVDEVVYPQGFDHPSVGIVWGNGALYDTWFSYLPVFIHGIQITPFSVGSLWLGRRPENVKRTMAYLEKGNSGSPHIWRDLFWMFEALEKPDQAYQRFQDEHWFEPEGGNTLAHTNHVLSALSVLGTIDPTVHADVPFHATFKDESGKLTHVAYNGSGEKKTVRFSDGVTVEVPPRSIASK